MSKIWLKLAAGTLLLAFSLALPLTVSPGGLAFTDAFATGYQCCPKQDIKCCSNPECSSWLKNHEPCNPE